jgi:hypothetical protein
MWRAASYWPKGSRTRGSGARCRGSGRCRTDGEVRLGEQGQQFVGEPEAVPVGDGVAQCPAQSGGEVMSGHVGCTGGPDDELVGQGAYDLAEFLGSAGGARNAPVQLASAESRV